MGVQLPKIPVAFLGLGLYRAWIEIVYVGTWIPFPTLPIAGQDLFDAAMVLALLACAVLHRLVTPLFRKRALLWVAAAFIALGTMANFATLAQPPLAPLVAAPAAIACGIGIALIILIWSELYACLSPYQVAVYYAASILAGAAVILLCRGFILPYACVAATALPLASTACVLCGFRRIPSANLPRRCTSRQPLPWTPIALMSLYAFAYGLRENELTAVMGPMSSAGVVAASSIVLVGIVCFRDRFDLDVMQRVALPAMVCSLVFVSAYNVIGTLFANICASFSYTAFSILIFCILCDLSRRFGFSAIMLFGLERGIRAIFSLLGRLVDSAVMSWGGHSVLSDVVVAGAIAVLVIAFALVLWRVPVRHGRWSVPRIDPASDDNECTGESSDAEAALIIACSLLRKRYELTPREEDVLFLLAQGKSIAEVAQSLVIAKGTAKVHVRHIYEKLGIHTREELKALVAEQEQR
ncbi:LuxR family transcriptional regulator [Enterorhabdus sp. NM05_H27]|nr:LuxR family transcriptional regulator [Enterorhabdus sp. NM05_H27]